MDDVPTPARRRRRIFLVLVALIAAAIALSQMLPPWLFPSGRIAEDERVVFFPTAASLSSDGTHWDVPIHGWVFEPESGDVARQGFVGTLRKLLGLDEDDDQSVILARRLRRFLVDNERGKRLTIRIAKREFTLEPSEKNGHMKASVRLPTAGLEPQASRGEVAVRAVTAADDPREFAGVVHLVPATGLSVISDIDDTVKLSEVTDKKKLLRNTFLEEFRAVPGMAERYRLWAAERGARFHFVSSSPWQLYEELAPFLREAGFPSATFHLKSVRLKDSSILELFADPLETKVAVIEPILRRFPQRRFVLVGDSGEKDPEVYAALAKRYPEQISRIFIRNVTAESASGSRFTDTFAGIADETWSLFTDPSSLVLE